MSKLEKQPFCATPKNYEEIEAFIMRMDPQARPEAIIVATLTWNLAVSIANENSTNPQTQK